MMGGDITVASEPGKGSPCACPAAPKANQVSKLLRRTVQSVHMSAHGTRRTCRGKRAHVRLLQLCPPISVIA
jgi:hypothetical protein